MKNSFLEYCRTIQERSKYLSSIITKSIIPLIEKIDFSKSDFKIEENAYCFALMSNKKSVPFSIVFWIDPARITFFLEDYEISDDYIDNEKESEKITTFIKNILTSEIRKEVYINENKQIKKIIYKYPLESPNGQIDIVEDVVKNEFSWFVKLTKTEFIFDKWID